MTGPEGKGAPAGLEAETHADALEALATVLGWRLTAPGWAAITSIVHDMSAALRAGDPAAFEGAVRELELAGPTRAVGLDDASTVEPPEPVREEVNELIHTLDGRRAP